MPHETQNEHNDAKSLILTQKITKMTSHYDTKNDQNDQSMSQ